MVIKNLLILSLFISFSFAIEYGYINIKSNVKGTTIELNGKQIGIAPMVNYKVEAYKDYSITAIADKTYYKNDIKKHINISKNNINNIKFNFEPASAKILLLGEPVELYINGKFIKKLNAQNRLTTVNATPNLKIKLINSNDDVLTIKKNIEADTKTNITYKLIKTNLEVKLYTTLINNNMWEDRKENATKMLDWRKAEIYCRFLELGGFHDWQLPTKEQLEDLYKNKTMIYNGFGKSFYWSRSMKSNAENLWQYAFIKYFETGESKYSVQEISKGHIRCVKSIKNNKLEIKEDEI